MLSHFIDGDTEAQGEEKQLDEEQRSLPAPALTSHALQPRTSPPCHPGQLALGISLSDRLEGNACITETWVIISQLFQISFHQGSS